MGRDIQDERGVRVSVANVIGQADILIRADASEFTENLKNQTKPAKSIGAKIGAVARKALKRSMQAGMVGIGAAAGAAVIGGFKAAVTRQNSQKVLSGLYGSAKQATQMMADLRDVSKNSPLEYSAYQKAAQSLAYAGVEGKSATGTLRNVGKAIVAAGGDSTKLDQAMNGVMKAVNNGGIAMMDSLSMISESGVPILSGLAEKFGKPIDQVKKMASEGKISIDDVLDVMENGTGGTFQQMIKAGDAASKSMSNQWKIQKDAVANAVGDVMLPLIEKITPAIEPIGNAITTSIGRLPEILNTVGNVMQTLAPYIAAVAAGFVAWNAGLLVHKGIAVATMVIESQWLTLTGMRVAAMYAVAAAQKAVNTAMRANPIGLILTAIVALVAGFVLAYNKIGWFRDAVNATWAAIKIAVSAVADWFTNTLWPSMQAVWQGIADGATWLWQNGIKPAWDGIMAAVRAVAEWFQTTLAPIFQTAMDAIGAVFTWLYENIVKPVFLGIQLYIKAWWTVVSTIFNALVAFFNAVLKPAFQIFGEVVRVVFQLITGIVQIWWAAVKIVFKAVVTYLKNTLGAAFKWFKDSIITPVWNGIKTAIKVSWDFIRAKVFQPIVNFINSQLTPRFNAFKATISVVWNAIKTTISTVWNKFIKPVFSAIVNYVKNQVQKRFNALRSTVSTVWNAIKSVISTVWNKGIKPILSTLVSFVKNHVQARFNALRSTVTSVWNAISSKIKGVWRSIKKVAFDPLAKAVKTTLPKAFRAGKNAIGKAWDGVKSVAKKPVRFVISTVINSGIIKSFNKLAGKFGVKKIAYAKLPKGFDSGGWTGPGRKLQPAGIVHADEFVIRKAAQRKITRRHGRGVLNYMNQTGNLPGHSEGGKVGLPGYAGGGMVWNNLWGIVKEKFPWARLTSAYRPGSITASGNSSYHSRGMAVDLAGRGSMNMSDMMKIFNFIHKNYGQSNELIHSPAGGRQIKNGRHYTYKGAVKRMHYNHVHWANRKRFSGTTAGASGSGGGVDIASILNPMLKPFKALKGKVSAGVKGAGAFGSMIGKGAKSMIGMPITWIKDNISKVVGDVGGAITKGVDWTKGQAWALKRGVSGANKSAMNWLVSKESGWNHKAQNPRSTASGLPQFINSTSRHYLGGAPAKKFGVWKQLDGMRKYVKERYGGWLGAQQFWKKHHWYDKGGVVKPLLRDKGGILPPGMNLVNNATGRNEYVVPPNVTDALMSGNVGGGDTYINVELSIDDLDGLQSALQFVEMLKRDSKTKRVRSRMTAKSGEVNA